MPFEKSLYRFYVVCFLFIAFLFVFIFRLIYIQLYQSQYLTKLASKQHNLYLKLPPQRGIVYDCNLKPLTVNIRSYSLFAVPADIKNKNKIADTLYDILGLDRNFTLNRISSKRHFAWLKRKISDKQALKIRHLNIEGLLLRKEDSIKGLIFN